MRETTERRTFPKSSHISVCANQSHFIFLHFQLDTPFFPSTYNICYPLSSTCFRPHEPIIRRSKLYMQPMVFSPSADVFVVRQLRKERLHDKDICRGGEYHRLYVQFRPPDDGAARPETCRGKRIADIVRRQKNSVSSWKGKKKICMHIFLKIEHCEGSHIWLPFLSLCQKEVYISKISALEDLLVSVLLYP